ncbi:MAG: hypothetical protein NVSMB19_07960 [Vulcanimicrobiaceae bacterium]
MRAVSTLEARYWIAAVVAFALFAVLGSLVSSRPPSAIDLAGATLRGEATPVAAFFTALGRTYPLLGIAAIAAIVALVARANPLPVLAVVIAQVLSQGAVASLKPLFHRLRPDHWLLYRESDLSFPSGHATTSIVFFLSLALLAHRLPNVPRSVAATFTTLAGICVVAIPWSRLALGAHYATDVTGGLLFGAGTLCAAIALLFRFGALA